VSSLIDAVGVSIPPSAARRDNVGADRRRRVT
jgi:hypothetical protein